MINSTIFSGNQGFTSANCIYFDGQNFSVFFSLFYNNTPADTFPLPLSPGYGGCMNILAHRIFIKFVEFSNNKKGKAGALSFFFPSSSGYKSLIFVENCWFINNQALFSAGIYVHSMSSVVFAISKSFFLSNYAKQSSILLICIL